MTENELELANSIVKNAQSLSNETMSLAFERVAPIIRQELPDVWEQAVRIFHGDETQALSHLTDKNIPFFEGKSALQTIADEGNTKRVLDNLNAIEYGVYM